MIVISLLIQHAPRFRPAVAATQVIISGLCQEMDRRENGNLKRGEKTRRAPGLLAHSSWTGYRPHLFTAMVKSWFFVAGTPYSVSYTHLRAHETRHDLVCRL